MPTACRLRDGTAGYLLPGAHQVAVYAGSLRPVSRGGQLLRTCNQLFLGALDACVAVVELREVCAAVAVEGGAGCAETLPQLVLYALRQVNFALCLLPRFEQFVHAGVGVLPVDLVGVLTGNLLGFRDDFFADGEGAFTVFGACLLLLLAEFSDLLCEGDEALLHTGVVTDHVAHTDLCTDGGDALLQVCGGGVVGEAGFEQGNLRLDVFKLAGEVAERFFFGGAGQLVYCVFFAVDNDEDVVVLGDAVPYWRAFSRFTVSSGLVVTAITLSLGGAGGGAPLRCSPWWAPVWVCVCTS